VNLVGLCSSQTIKVGTARCAVPVAVAQRLATERQTLFPVAVPPVRSDDRENDERHSPQTRHVVADHGGKLAPLPEADGRPAKPKTKCVNHFAKMLVSQLTGSHM
jgi:hypothetical protein